MAADSGFIVPACPPDAGPVLIRLARAAISSELGVTTAAAGPEAGWLDRAGASFITLMLNEKLRGCIGTLRPHRTLAADVRANALGAAFRDPRFAPLTAPELSGVSVEISVLSPLEPVLFRDEADALRQLRAGLDGLVFEYGRHTSTFLPQVWTDVREPADFLAHLKYKAGLPPDFWHQDVKLSRYTVQKWREGADG
jgi:AmmeMemoRadiSam system protein A